LRPTHRCARLLWKAPHRVHRRCKRARPAKLSGPMTERGAAPFVRRPRGAPPEETSMAPFDPALLPAREASPRPPVSADEPASATSPACSATSPARPTGFASASKRPHPASGGADRRLGVIAVLISTVGMGLSGLFGRLATPEGAATGEALTLGRMA